MAEQNFEIHSALPIESLSLVTTLPKERSVFVNRNLRMENIKFVGFDLDWTLAPYCRLPLEELTFKLIIDRLIQRFGYPQLIASSEFRPDFSCRGLLVDKLEGTVIKMDRHRYVGKAYLGRRQLDRDERVQLYRHKRIDLSRERFYHVDTLFELPEVNVFSELAELIERKKLSASSYQQVFRDVRNAIDGIHADTTLKNLIITDLPKYINSDQEMVLALQRLSMGDRRLILITNSEWYYTDSICSHLFNKHTAGVNSWRDIFDLVIVGAHKPLFFTESRPFLEISSDGNVLAETLVPEWGKAYMAGSREGLMALLGASGESVLYIGDHIYGDIRWSRLSSTWRTALIVSELEHEISSLGSHASEVSNLLELREKIQNLGFRKDQLLDILQVLNNSRLPESSQEVRQTRRQLNVINVEHRALRNKANNLQSIVDCALNPVWGSVFKEGESKSLFGAQVEDFACLYTSNVGNFGSYGRNHYFRVLRDPMPHETL